MSEQDDTTEIAAALFLVAIIALVVGLLLCACFAYNRYRKRPAPENRVLDAGSCFDAMVNCFCCCGECLGRAGKGASDATVSAVGAVKNGAEVAVTESRTFWCFTCHWLEWLLSYAFCCCCYDTRYGASASGTSATLPVGVPVAEPLTVEGANRSESGKEDESQSAVVPAVRVGAQDGSLQSAEGQSASDAASVTTPLLALAV